MGPFTGRQMRHGYGGWTRVSGRQGAIALAFLLVPVPAYAANAAPGASALVAVAVAAGAVALAIAAALWAIAEQRAASRLRRSLRVSGARARAASGARDALIAAGREAVLVWGRGDNAPYSYGGGEQLLNSCLAGADATELSRAMDALSDHGAAFALTAHDRTGRAILVRARAVGGMAAMWLEPEPEKAQLPDFRAVLDALPMPVWLRDKTLALIWGNRAFVSASGAESEEAAVAAQKSLDKSDRDLASAARAEGHTMEAKRFAVLGGHRRALAFTHVPIEQDRIVGSAIDVTDLSNAEARLQQHIDAHADTLDKLATAVAIFGRDQKLTFYNQAYAVLWGLEGGWLDRHPTDGEILDQLREARKLPEQRDYQAWKRGRLALYEQGAERLPEELWHVPSGKTLRVVAQPHPFGGLTFLYEDVSEKLELESSYNTLIKVQSATLDTLQEAVAVFAPDGRLKLHNAAFARIWELEPQILEGRTSCAAYRRRLHRPVRRRSGVAASYRSDLRRRRNPARLGRDRA